MEREPRRRLAGNLERTAPQNGLRRHDAEGAEPPLCSAKGRTVKDFATKANVEKSLAASSPLPSPPSRMEERETRFFSQRSRRAPQLTAAGETVFAIVRNSWPTRRNAICIARDCIAWPGRRG